MPPPTDLRPLRPPPSPPTTIQCFCFLLSSETSSKSQHITSTHFTHMHVSFIVARREKWEASYLSDGGVCLCVRVCPPLPPTPYRYSTHTHIHIRTHSSEGRSDHFRSEFPPFFVLLSHCCFSKVCPRSVPSVPGSVRTSGWSGGAATSSGLNRSNSGGPSSAREKKHTSDVSQFFFFFLSSCGSGQVRRRREEGRSRRE